VTDSDLPGGHPVVAGRYELQTLIGRGGTASVYRAWDRGLERWTAVKVLPSDIEEPALDRRRSEIRLLASVNHPGLVTLFDAVAEPEATYLVMELVEGGTLRGRIHLGPVDAHALAAIATDIAGALAHIHARGIVHRDVKPANILLDAGDGRTPAAKLSDFGIAKLLETAPNQTTGILGTAQYLSPEQARGLSVGPASDVYSLGLALLEAATGRTAFPGGAVESLSARLLRDPDVPGALGYGWRSLLTAMTSREPASRPTAQEVAERARALLDRQDAPHDPAAATLPIARTAVMAVEPDRPATDRRDPRRGRGVLAGVLAAAAVAALVLALLVPALRDASAADPSTDPQQPARSATGTPVAVVPTATASPSRSSAVPVPRPATSRETTAAGGAASETSAVEESAVEKAAGGKGTASAKGKAKSTAASKGNGKHTGTGSSKDKGDRKGK
jgi:serine/threonine protein kinase